MPPAKKSQKEYYGDEHRMFVQGIMSRGIMNTQEVQELFRRACEAFKVPVPSDNGEQTEKLRNFILCINHELDDLYLTIKKACDEESRYKDSYFVLCNKLDRSDDPTGLGKRAMVDFSGHELEFLRIILEAILLETDDHQLSQMTALHLASDVKSKKMSQQEAEKVIEKFVEHSWLTLSKNKKKIRLSTRFLAEMDPYLCDYYKDDIANCNLCHKTVVRSLKCGGCDRTYHFHCLVTTAPDGKKSSKFGVCKDCEEEIPFDGFED